MHLFRGADFELTLGFSCGERVHSKGRHPLVTVQSSEVVLDSSFEALFEGSGWFPAKGFNLLGFERVALVVAGAIVYELDEVSSAPPASIIASVTSRFVFSASLPML